jgi:hypothetical protein
MSEWIKQRADQIRNAEREKKEEAERKAAAASDLKAQVIPFWNELVEAIHQSVTEFNTEFPETDRRIEPFNKTDPNTFNIRRTAYPSVILKVQLSASGTNVQYQISRTLRKGINTVEKQSTFALVMKDGKPCYSEAHLQSHEDVAKLFLDAFFEF